MKYLILALSLLSINSMAYAGKNPCEYGEPKCICFPSGQCIDAGDVGIFP
ncbi:hypothetical protein SAMN04489802_0484 [Pseudomonas chlororaphis]|jgi:hypothetical protein|nr:hypothetical protein C4K17_6053 [Pseudomonas chlororaphis subsp. aurantiaca]AZE13997.1 hypothetical protein C4K10_5762 [Pseudomonas chlororaphis subsp. aureofaciens]SDS03612.1 hypothetical protein SAMN04489802_0484 [Pseudomonas chlororaphis]